MASVSLETVVLCKYAVVNVSFWDMATVDGGLDFFFLRGLGER